MKQDKKNSEELTVTAQDSQQSVESADSDGIKNDSSARTGSKQDVVKSVQSGEGKSGAEELDSKELNPDEHAANNDSQAPVDKPAGQGSAGPEIPGPEVSEATVAAPDAPGAEKPGPEKLEKKSSWLRVLLYIFLVLFVPAVLATGYAAYDVWNFLNDVPEHPGRELSIVIEPGTGFDRVTADLYKMGVIKSPWRFKLLAQYKKKSGSLKAGEFAVNTGWKPEMVLENLVNGKPLLYRLTVREGLSWWETAKVIEEAGFAKADDFAQVIHDRGFLDEHNIPFDSAEGFLFPETYLLQKPRKLGPAEAEAIAGLLVDTFWSKAGPVLLRSFNAGVASAGDKANKQDALDEKKLQNSETTPPDPIADQGSEQGINNPLEAPVAGPGALAGTDSETNLEPVSGSVSGAVAGTEVVGAVKATMPAQVSTNAQAPGAAQNGTSPNTFPNTFKDRSTPELPTSDKSASAKPASVTSLKDIPPDELRRLVILASLVEKETAVPDERARVAGVYSNRLKKKMLLQCDPTIIYGIGPSFKGSITRSQLNDAKNLYNTYKHAGLPPGPICSPGLAAVKAAAAPDTHDYLYFVATGKPDGSHTFSSNLQDHNRAVQVFRRADAK